VPPTFVIQLTSLAALQVPQVAGAEPPTITENAPVPPIAVREALKGKELAMQGNRGCAREFEGAASKRKRAAPHVTKLVRRGFDDLAAKAGVNLEILEDLIILLPFLTFG
jgi:hypothetical protein